VVCQDSECVMHPVCISLSTVCEPAWNVFTVHTESTSHGSGPAISFPIAVVEEVIHRRV
jgi:hypothetical protein